MVLNSCYGLRMTFTLTLRDRSQTLVRGAWCKKYLSRKFFGAPLQTAKKFQGPLFLPWKLRVNPIEKHVNSIFNGKSVVIFFRAPLTRVKNVQGPPFCIRPPLTSVCELSLTLLDLTKSYKNYLQNTQHVVLRNGPTLSIGAERLACLNSPHGVQLGTLA